MKKGLIFACALVIGLALAANAIPLKKMPKAIKDSDVTTRDYTAPVAKAPIYPGVVIGETDYADAWRGSAGMYGKNILVTPDGQNISVVYGAAAPGSGQGFVFGYSYDAGATWDNTVLDNSINIRIYPGGGMDADNIPYIVWQDRDTNSIQWMKDEGGIGAGAWTSPDTLARDSMAWYLPSMNIVGTKMMISAFAHGLAAGDYGVGDYSIHMSLSNDLGATWQDPWGRLPLPYGWNNWATNIYPGWDQDDADWIMSASGDTVIGFYEMVVDTVGFNFNSGYDGFYPTYKISYDGGITWTAPQYFTPPQQYNYGGWWYRYDGTWAAGKPHFLYCHGDNNWNGLALFDYTPTVAGDYSNWTLTLVSDISGDQATNFNGGWCDVPTISSDESGNIFAVYQDMSKDTLSLELFGAASTDGGATWLTPVQMTTSHGGLDGNIYCEQSSNAANGLVHVMYHDSLYLNIHYFDYPTANLLAAPVRPDAITLPCDLVDATELLDADVDGSPAGGLAGDGTLDVITADPIYFIWSPKVPVDGKYLVQASTTPDFSDNVWQFKDGRLVRNYVWDGTQYPVDLGVTGMPSNGTWYWRVRTYRGLVASPWSEVFDFDYQLGVVNTTDWQPYTGVTGGDQAAPSAFMLAQSRPNPVRDNAAISFSLPKAGAYSLKVYNVAGQVVRTIDGNGNTGMNTVNLNSRNLSNGIYFYQLTAGGNTATRKMVILK